MHIHAMCLVKNEADIIGQTITAALDWCDHIYVYDNGSDDGTWEKVNELAARHPQVVAFKQDGRPFSDRIRAEIFDAFRSRSHEGDWWCLLDSDEFYVENPRVFLAKVPASYQTVWMASFDYYFTDRDAERYEQDPSQFADDVPIQQRCRYYLNHWSELRFFRYSPSLTWQGSGSVPDGLITRPAYPVRIWQRHYAYRSPAQIERRLRTRAAAVQNDEFVHEALDDWGGVIADIRANPDRRLAHTSATHATTAWTDRIVKADSLDYDALDGRLVVNEALMPPLPTRSSVAVDRVRRPMRRIVNKARRIVAERKR